MVEVLSMKKRRWVYPCLINHAPPGSFLTGPSLLSLRCCPFVTIPLRLSLCYCPFVTVTLAIVPSLLAINPSLLAINPSLLAIDPSLLVHSTLAHHATYRATVPHKWLSFKHCMHEQLAIDCVAIASPIVSLFVLRSTLSLLMMSISCCLGYMCGC